VDPDCGEDEPEDDRCLAGEVGGCAAEREQEPGNEEPGQQGQPRDARLGRDGDRRVVRGGRLRLLALEVLLLSVGVLEASDPDSDHGVMDRQFHAVGDELRTAARDAIQVPAVEDRVSHVG